MGAMSCVVVVRTYARVMLLAIKTIGIEIHGFSISNFYAYGAPLSWPFRAVGAPLLMGFFPGNKKGDL